MHLIRHKSKGFSLTELMIGVIIASILVAGIVQMMKVGTHSTKKSLDTGRMDETLNRFVTLMTNDLNKAGSDPRGQTLQSYIYEATCAGKLIFKYGIDPEPASPSCTSRLGDIGIMSYVAYDANGDGTTDPEEGIDLASAVPTLRTTPEDYVVYEFSNNTVIRKNLGNPDSTAEDTQATALENVVWFHPRYYGYDDTGVYGEITDNARYDDIREVEISVMIHSGSPEQGYTNSEISTGNPLWTPWSSSPKKLWL